MSVQNLVGGLCSVVDLSLFRVCGRHGLLTCEALMQALLVASGGEGGRQSRPAVRAALGHALLWRVAHADAGPLAVLQLAAAAERHAVGLPDRHPVRRAFGLRVPAWCSLAVGVQGAGRPAITYVGKDSNMGRRGNDHGRGGSDNIADLMQRCGSPWPRKPAS